MPAAAWEVWSTTAEVYTRDDAALPEAVRVTREVLAATTLAASRFDAGSEVCRLAARPDGRLAASPLLRDLVREALRAAEVTGGLVDPTLGTSLVALGYDRDLQTIDVDAPVAVRVARRTRWQAVEVDDEREELRVPRGTLLDLGAVAKAYSADLAAQRAHELTGAAVLVSLGGDIAAVGILSDHPWVVGVAERSDDAAVVTVEVYDGGLATSTTLSRRWGGPQRRLHHLLDPRTGHPAEEVWRTVTVAAATCVDANIAATAAVVMGAAAPGWLRAQGLPGRLVGRDGSVRAVAGWPAEEVA